MKTSVSVFLSDILPDRRSFYNKIVKNDFFTKQTPKQGLTTLKQHGMDGIEICLPQYSITSDEDVKNAKAILDEVGLQTLSVHQALRFFTTTKIDEISRLFEIAAMFGAKVIVLHMNTAKKQIFDPKYVSAIHALEKEYGIVAAFENMEKHIASLFYEHRWQELKFSELVEKTDFHITFDIVHLAHSGGDIIEFYKKNRDRIVNIHLSDYKHNALNSSIRPMRYKHMPLGKGELPITDLLKVIRQDNYKGLITMEIHGNLKDICNGAAEINKAKS